MPPRLVDREGCWKPEISHSFFQFTLNHNAKRLDLAQTSWHDVPPTDSNQRLTARLPKVFDCRINNWRKFVYKSTFSLEHKLAKFLGFTLNLRTNPLPSIPLMEMVIFHTAISQSFSSPIKIIKELSRLNQRLVQICHQLLLLCTGSAVKLFIYCIVTAFVCVDTLLALRSIRYGSCPCITCHVVCVGELQPSFHDLIHFIPTAKPNTMYM